jgi:DNA-binding transcriptional LysR family regulator
MFAHDPAVTGRLVDEGFDIAVCTGALEDSRGVSRKLTSLSRCVYASRLGQAAALPQKPESIDRCSAVTLQAYASYDELMLHTVERNITVAGHIRVNSIPMMRRLLLASAGTGLVPGALMADNLTAGRVVKTTCLGGLVRSLTF